ncbi:hypothetical protein EYF80_018449 [Liparis tanakae]|uniref:Uncharacterized protein n=1 Tax=Liparis tanakae TaxID=230148 RepID=A0A4Z2I0N6_9TELE|nr:hypothetical protein EYF80_018449 [Liparis tanakae]
MADSRSAPVSGDLHLQVLLDAEELLVVVLGALHVQPELRELVLQLVQGELQQLHLGAVLMARLIQVTVQRPYLRRERSHQGNPPPPPVSPWGRWPLARPSGGAAHLFLQTLQLHLQVLQGALPLHQLALSTPQSLVRPHESTKLGQLDIKQLVFCECRLQNKREGQNENETRPMSSNGEGDVINSVLKDLHAVECGRRRKEDGGDIVTHQTHLVVVLLNEEPFFCQGVQIYFQGGYDLLVIGLGLPQSQTVSLHRLRHHQFCLPPKVCVGALQGTHLEEDKEKETC